MNFVVEGLSQRLGRQEKVRRIGEYGTAADAMTAARSIVEEFLRREFKPGMDAEMLFSVYRLNAEHPYIFRSDGDTFSVPGFNHDQHARTCSSEICSANK